MNFLKKLNEKAKELKKEIIALSLAIKDKRTPRMAKLMIGLTLSYALSPIDLIPDFIPVFGYLDDLIILPLMIMISIKLIPGEVLADCRTRAGNDIKLNKKIGLYSAIGIIIIWISVTAIIILRFIKTI